MKFEGEPLQIFLKIKVHGVPRDTETQNTP